LRRLNKRRDSMCNEWQGTWEELEPKRIKKEGKGWKIVHSDGTKDYRPIRGYINYTTAYFWNKKNGWHVHDYYNDNVGFCFFTNKKVAKKALNHALKNFGSFDKNHIIVPIEYKGGIGSCLTDDESWTKDTRFAFCKQFRFVEELKDDR